MTPQEKVNSKLYELKQTAKMLFKVEVANFNVSYDLTTQRALGSVKIKHDSVTMRLNSLLLEENTKLYIDEIVTHEYAHLIVDARFPSGYNGHRRVQPHGREFKAVCRAFGIDGKSTTKAFANSPILRQHAKLRRKSKFTHYYRCSCAIPKELSTVRHNKVVAGKTQYQCNNCKTKLSFIKTV